jgi:hypothetical protein
MEHGKAGRWRTVEKIKKDYQIIMVGCEQHGSTGQENRNLFTASSCFGRKVD